MTHICIHFWIKQYAMNLFLITVLLFGGLSISVDTESQPTVTSGRQKNRNRHPVRQRDVIDNSHQLQSNHQKQQHLQQQQNQQQDGFCQLEINCKGDEGADAASSIKLPIKGPRGPPGPPGEKGERGLDGYPGSPGMPAPVQLKKKVAFFAGLTDNFGPVTENTDIVFDRVVTNIGSSFSPSTGRFTAPVNGAYQFNVIVSAQGREKAAVMVLKNGEMVATVWAESIPFWATASNIVVLSLEKGDQVWLLLLTRASHLHGYMYTTFSGFIIFEL